MGLLALELFGYSLPSPGIAAVLVLGIAAFFLVNRSNSGQEIDQTATGKAYECKRCGAEFQIDHVELLPSGDVHRFRNEACPECGWRLGSGDPNDK